jgi:RHS repeat-associated protein
MDALYSYDKLQQVTSWKRGNLSPSGGPPYSGVTSQKQGEEFTYDQTGNWLGDVSDNPNFTQSRAHNVKNRITSITGPTGVVQPVYDNAGNMTLAPSPGSWTVGYAYKWDAWNRLVEIKQSGTVIGSYAYDALTRRTRKTVGGVTRDIYYDRQWRSVEERDTSTGTVKVQHAWSPLDRWTLIRRKRNASGGTLNETLFCLRDYLDPVALANTSGVVVERYNYDAFGTVRIMNASFGVLGNSAYEWEFLYHGEFRDKESQLYNYGYRYLDTQLGRWLSRDPIGEEAGENLYSFNRNSSTNRRDLYGLIDDKAARLAKCKEMMEKGKAIEKIKKLLEKFGADCPLDLECICCNEDKRVGSKSVQGFYDRKSKETRMCAGRAKDQEEFDRFLYEEISHALQSCGKLTRPKKNDNCEDCLCNEIQAKSGAPHARNKNEIVAEAFLSCIGSCLKNDEDPVDQMEAIINKGKQIYDECSKRNF